MGGHEPIDKQVPFEDLGDGFVLAKDDHPKFFYATSNFFIRNGEPLAPAELFKYLKGELKLSRWDRIKGYNIALDSDRIYVSGKLMRKIKQSPSILNAASFIYSASHNEYTFFIGDALPASDYDHYQPREPDDYQHEPSLKEKETILIASSNSR